MRIAATLGALLLLACASVPHADDPDALRREGLVHSDVASLRELFVDGLRYGHSNGQMHAKEEMLGLLGSGELDYRSIEIEEIDTRELAGAVVVTGRQTIEAALEGRAVSSRSLFTAVYMREGRRWKLVAYQSTPLPLR